MGMYTELVFNASLKSDTPEYVINAISFMVGYIEEKPKDFPLPDGRCEWLLRGSSCYFEKETEFKFYVDESDKRWRLISNSSIKNYENEIEEFLKWIKPYIEQGYCNLKNSYAIVTYEEDDHSTFYKLPN